MVERSPSIKAVFVNNRHERHPIANKLLTADFQSAILPKSDRSLEPQPIQQEKLAMRAQSADILFSDI